jgi:hypothetical protein
MELMKLRTASLELFKPVVLTSLFGAIRLRFMKTNPSLKVFKLPALASLGIAIGLTQPVFGDVIHQLVITEKSSTSLTATFDGTPLSVTMTVPDTWVVNLPAPINNGFLVAGQWVEPENSGDVNIVQGSRFSFVTVNSDVGGTGVANSTTIDFGTYSADGAAIQATFNDKSDVASAPDTGCTLGLLFLALTALVGVNSFRYLRST